MKYTNANIKRLKYTTPACLIIIDGLGVSKKRSGNALYAAGPLFLKEITRKYPTALVATHGTAVGLPPMIVGSSEVGHTNIGAGRIVEQDITIINRAIRDKTFFKNPTLLAAMRHAKSKGAALHLMGLLSDGKVHADIEHLIAILKLAHVQKVSHVYLHLFTDGRDLPPTASIRLIKKLQRVMRRLGTGTIATLAGRHYAMDRIEHWGRVGGVHTAIAEAIGNYRTDPLGALHEYHKQGITDRFIPPTVIVDANNCPCPPMKSGDAVIFFNLRSDRARALTKTFVKPEAFEGSSNHTHRLRNLFFVALTDFGEDLPVHIAYDNSHITKTLPEVIANTNHMRQLYIAEEEKFPHITYFLHGLSSRPLRNENKIKIASKNVATYDKAPAMSAREVTQEVLDSLDADMYDFIGVNFANPDMVAHTGNFKATVRAIQIIDKEIKKISKKVLEKDGVVFIVSDHGNADLMGSSKRPITYHSKNPVYFSIISNNRNIKLKKRGILANVAPTILAIMGIKRPKMWNEDLLK